MDFIASEQRIKNLFNTLDKNGDGNITKIELISALRNESVVVELADIFGIPQEIKQEDGSRDKFMEVFHAIDADSSGNISYTELKTFILKKYPNSSKKPTFPSSSKPQTTTPNKSTANPSTGPSTNNKPATNSTKPATPNTSGTSTNTSSSSSSNTGEEKSKKFVTWAFNFIDKDKSGRISKAELLVGVRQNDKIAVALGLPRTIAKKDGSEAKFNEIFSQMDIDNSGHVTLDEFVSFFSKYNSNEQKDPKEANDSSNSAYDKSASDFGVEDKVGAFKLVVMAFEFIDSNNNNSIDKSELIKAVMSNEFLADSLEISSYKKPDLDKLFNNIDSDKSGIISKSEFIKFFLQHINNVKSF